MGRVTGYETREVGWGPAKVGPESYGKVLGFIL